MCKGNNCQSNEEVAAVRNKVTRMVNNALTVMEEIANKRAVDVQVEASTITKKLFDNMTKQDIIDGILDGDVLSFKNLEAREDVQEALAKTQELYVTAFEHAIEIGGVLSDAELTINDRAEAIIEDVIIFGITDGVRAKIVSLEGEIEAILSNI